MPRIANGPYNADLIMKLTLTQKCIFCVKVNFIIKALQEEYNKALQRILDHFLYRDSKKIHGTQNYSLLPRFPYIPE